MSAWGLPRVKVLALVSLLVAACGQPAVAGDTAAHVVAVIPVRATPSAGLEASSSAVWVPSDIDGSISRVDPLTNEVTASIDFGSGRSCTLCWGAVATHAESVWATSSSARLTLLGIDPRSNQITSHLPLPVFPSAVMTTSDGAVWIASVLDSAVLRFDPASEQVLTRINIPRPSRLAAGDGALWVISLPDDAPDGRVVAIDTRTDRIIANVEVGVQPIAIAVGEGSVWVVDQGRQRLQRIDPIGGVIAASIPVGFLPTGVAVGQGSIWVVSLSAPGVDGPALSRIDPASNTNVGSIPVGHGAPIGVAVGAGSLWVATRNPDTIVRVDAPASTAAAGGQLSPLVAVVVVAALGLVSLAIWRRPPAPARCTPAASGRQLRELRDFSRLRRGTTGPAHSRETLTVASARRSRPGASSVPRPGPSGK